MSATNRENLSILNEAKFPTQGNNEIEASDQREFNEKLIDSLFNLLTDKLSGLRYNDTLNLAQYLATLTTGAPLWGSTDWFNPNSSNGNIQSYNDNGIVSNITYEPGSSQRNNIIINFNQNISSRKLSLNLFTDNSNPSAYANISELTITPTGLTQIKVGMRETSGGSEKLRIEILAF